MCGVIVRQDDNWSEIQNAFWTKGIGFDPLLPGMGAGEAPWCSVR